MTLTGLMNNLEESKSNLEAHELLDRFEFLHDEVDELKDLRRAILDKDLSSIFRLVGSITRSKLLYEELRKAVIETNVHSLFRVLEVLDKNEFDELRKAVLEKNLHAIFRVIQSIDSNEGIELIRNSIINEGNDIEVLRKTISLFVKSEALDTLVKTLRNFS